MTSVDPQERVERITAVIRALVPGEVASYGDIAEVAGYPGQARLVGRVLAAGEGALPWWRVVDSTGRLVPGAESEQRRRLRAEGVTVGERRVTAAPSGRFAKRRSRPDQAVC